MSRRSLRAFATRLPALALVVLCTAWALPATAADTASIDNAQPADGAVQLLVSVPGDGTVDLTKVAVKIGGKPVASTSVPAASSDDVERTTILAIDTSDSMAGTRIAEAKKAAGAYLAGVPANVKVGVVTFDDKVTVQVAPTTDRAAATAAVAGLTLTRNTALYDGVLGAIDAAGPGGDQAGQRKILVLSDGKDTTGKPLAAVLSAIKTSGVGVDVVAVQQQDATNGPLGQMAAAGKGIVIDTQDPAALTATFAGEADDLARQILVTAQLPAGSKDTSATVAVSIPTTAGAFTTSAYVPVRATSSTGTAKDTGPLPAAAGSFTVPKVAMLGGVGAIGVGLIGALLVLAFASGGPSKATALNEQMGAYGVNAVAAGGSGSAPVRAGQNLSLADQAKQAAERALANNKSLEARIASRLEGAGMSLKPAEWVLLHAGIAVVAGLFGTLIGGGSIVLGVVFVVAGAVVPWVYLGFKRGKRLKAFNTGLADTLQLMSGSLSAGLSLAQSIDTIVREGQEPITSEFKRVVVESRLGVGLEDSLEGVAERMESKDFEWVVMAIRIQREVGGNLAELLLTVAATLRERDYLRRQVRSLSAEGRLSCYILGGLPPAFLLYLTVSKPDYVKPMYSTPIGWILCAGMSVLLGVGILWMSKVAKVDV